MISCYDCCAATIFLTVASLLVSIVVVNLYGAMANGAHGCAIVPEAPTIAGLFAAVIWGICASLACWCAVRRLCKKETTAPNIIGRHAVPCFIAQLWLLRSDLRGRR